MFYFNIADIEATMNGEMTEELTGYLEVKVPSRERKRGFTPWKAWKRQLCLVRRGDSVQAPVQVHLGNGTFTRLQVAHGSTLWRTQSRTKQFAFGVFSGPTEPKKPVLFLAGRSETEAQKWMAHFRWLLRPPQEGMEGDFFVSLIDNPFSLSSGLTGAYGNLKITPHEVTLNDPSSDEVKVTWEWQHILKCHLAAAGRFEDEKKICVLRTSSDWAGGYGQLYLFCEQAPQLLQSLTRGQKSQNIHISPCPSPTFPFRNSRRLSRSENDLRQYWNMEDATDSGNTFAGIKFRRKHFAVNSNGSSQDSSKHTSTYSEDSGVPASSKTKSGSSLPTENRAASSLLAATLGLAFFTPGCSDNESLHEYQKVGFCNSDDDLVGDMVETEKYRSPRRESGISIASGIYEEIAENLSFTPEESHMFYNYSASSPPPLPPRTRLPDLERHDSDRLSSLIRSRCFSTSSSPQLQYASSNLTPSSSWDIQTARNRFFWPSEATSINSSEPEPDYLPMSPINKTLTVRAPPMEEQHYMVMASINTT